MRRCFFLMAGLMAMIMAVAEPSAAADFSYDLKAAIEPSAGSVSVRGQIVVPVEPGQRELGFVLHRTFTISRLTVDGKKAAFVYQPPEPTPFTPASRKVVVSLPAEHGSTIRLAIAYAGVLERLPEWGASEGQKWAMDDQVNGRLVQLASYSSWYPQIFAFGRKFDSRLEVSLPEGWIAVSGGAKEDFGLKSGRAVTRWSVPANFDITITAAPNFRKVADGAIEIYHTSMPDSLVEREARELSAVMGLFRSRLGDAAVPGGVIRHVFAPMVHGQGRAGIARAGIIITSEGRVREALAANPDYSLFQDVAHEIAHFWWNFGSGQGDWINEAFAEYYSALAVRDLVSQEKFEAVLENYRARVRSLPADAPSLATVPKEGGSFFVRYYKGSLMLDAIRRAMGDDAFFAASRTFFETYHGKEIGTAEFRAFWSPRVTGLDLWIERSGGLPAP